MYIIYVYILELLYFLLMFLVFPLLRFYIHPGGYCWVFFFSLTFSFCVQTIVQKKTFSIENSGFLLFFHRFSYTCQSITCCDVQVVCYGYDSISIIMLSQMIGKRETLCRFIKRTVNNQSVIISSCHCYLNVQKILRSSYSIAFLIL